MVNEKITRGLSNIRRRLTLYFGYGFNFLMKVLYFGGIPLSILYGKSFFLLLIFTVLGISTRPPMLMMGWYSLIGN